MAAMRTRSGYDVALELPGGNEFTVWATNSSGAYVSSLVGIVPGNNATLESLETVFNKDLNGDSIIGVPVSSQVAGTTGNGSVTAGLLTANSSDHFHFNSGGAAGQTGASAPTGAMPNVWHDSFLFTANHGPGGGTASPASWAETVPS